MKVTVKKKDNAVRVAITTEYIKLQDALKFANVVYSGGEAKTVILEEQVKVNGEICTMRGKKLRPGDKVEFAGQHFVICEHEAE
jgi:ribosome-associated protein